MKIEDIKGTPFDYSDDKVNVYFEVADKLSAREVLEGIQYIGELNESKYGFEVIIAIQQIPEVIRSLSKRNIAIYAVVPKN